MNPMNPIKDHDPRTPAHITYVGHATLLVELDGTRLLTDPILRNRVSFLRRRASATFQASQYADVDAVLISHLHRDHLDVPSLRLLDRNTHMVVPHGSGRLLSRLGFGQITEMRVGETVGVGSVKIEATFADHHSARQPFGLHADALGYLIYGKSTIYFAGDTDLFPDMVDLSAGLDVALLPVWGWGPTLGTGHMDPLRAAEALTLLQPQKAIPIHWGALYPAGTGWLNPAYLSQPPHSFAQHAARLAPDVDVHIVHPGETVGIAAA